MGRKNFLVCSKLLTSAVLWGGTFIAAKILAKDMGPFSAAFLRFVIASFFLILILAAKKKESVLPSTDKIIPIFLLGFFGIFLHNFCFFSGLKYIEAGRASVIVATNPILIALFSSLIFREKLNFQKFAGILVSITGAVLVITRGNILSVFSEPIGKGELFLFANVASWVTYSIAGKIFLKDFSPLQTVTYSVAAGALLLFLPAYNEGLFSFIHSLSFLDLSALFYLGFFGTVIGFVFYYQGIEKIGPTKAGLFINFVPVSGVFLSYLLLDEPLRMSLISGLILVITGVYLTNMDKELKSFMSSFSMKEKPDQEEIKEPEPF